MQQLIQATQSVCGSHMLRGRLNYRSFGGKADDSFQRIYLRFNIGAQTLDGPGQLRIRLMRLLV